MTTSRFPIEIGDVTTSSKVMRDRRPPKEKQPLRKSNSTTHPALSRAQDQLSTQGREPRRQKGNVDPASTAEAIANRNNDIEAVRRGDMERSRLYGLEPHPTGWDEPGELTHFPAPNWTGTPQLHEDPQWGNQYSPLTLAGPNV
ncbi:hypothetical protein EI94DRAFT_1806284 [Lactarius quietus]|nr:hypothetical protein EI94DRAFT_1806284 [Lactarius quietus]